MNRLTAITFSTLSAICLLAAFASGAMAAPPDGPSQLTTNSASKNSTKDSRHDQWADLISVGNAARSEDGKSVLYKQAVATKSKPFKPARSSGKPVNIDPSAQKIATDGERLLNKIIQTNGKIDPQQEKAYDRQMFSLIKKMDALNLSNLGGGSQQDGPAGCMLECDGAYPGLGGGNGWNRFWCKSSCLKINVGRAGIGGQ